MRRWGGPTEARQPWRPPVAGTSLDDDVGGASSAAIFALASSRCFFVWCGFFRVLTRGSRRFAGSTSVASVRDCALQDRIQRARLLGRWCAVLKDGGLRLADQRRRAAHDFGHRRLEIHGVPCELSVEVGEALPLRLENAGALGDRSAREELQLESTLASARGEINVERQNVLRLSDQRHGALGSVRDCCRRGLHRCSRKLRDRRGERRGGVRSRRGARRLLGGLRGRGLRGLGGGLGEGHGTTFSDGGRRRVPRHSGLASSAS